MTIYTEEQFLYFTSSLNRLESSKKDKETYWNEYKKLQAWLEEQQLSTDFINWAEKRLKNNI
ncbi:hypothetical protein BKK42_04315 [Bacillus cereus]|nr:hypothetical protein BKK43_10050 [Bacillus cereus]ONG86954.1 hypothetical protein BKK42_04315 [Bacillus cereus]